jgi:hypothetical protein
MQTSWDNDLPQVTDKLYHIMLYTSPWVGVESTTTVVIGTDCIGSCKSNYRKITTTTAPPNYEYYPNLFAFLLCLLVCYLITVVHVLYISINWNIAESGVKHHQTNHPTSFWGYSICCLTLRHPDFRHHCINLMSEMLRRVFIKTRRPLH